MSADEEEALPEALKVPLGRAGRMLDDAAIVPLLM